MNAPLPPLAWLASGEEFPPASSAWGTDSPAAGLLAAGGDLSVQSLCRAYSHGIFPWYSRDQPILWWSPEPRMVLDVAQFRLQPSFRKSLKRFIQSPGCEVRFDSAFDQVIQACASSQRKGQTGTWIVPAMVDAYQNLHCAGFAHSVETWVEGELIGGLYCVALGQAVFGESMFSRSSGASKIALAALVGFCRQQDIVQIDCQQNTAHLARLGAAEVPRQQFLQTVMQSLTRRAPQWSFDRGCWQLLLPTKPSSV